MVRPTTTGRAKTKEGEIEIYCRGTLPEDIIRRFDEIARQEERTRNAHFLWLVKDYVKQKLKE